MLLADIEASQYLDIKTENNGEIARNFTLDLNGHSITPADGYNYNTGYPLLYVGINQTLTIKGEGTISAAKKVTVGVYGILNLEGGTIVNTGATEDDAAIDIYYWNNDLPSYEGIVGGTGYITGGNIQGNVWVDEPDEDGEATLVISGGKFTDDVTEWLEGGLELDENGTVIVHVHSYDSVVTAPTCTVDGYTTHTCRCGDTYTDTTVTALGHDMVVDAAVAPTCTATGLTEGAHCSRCDHKVAQEVVDALGHDMVVDAAKAPTCTATGLTEGAHCSRCDHKVSQETVGALGHDMVTDEAVAPTCTETGLTEGSHCSRCDDVTTAQEVVDALGHDMVVDAAKAPTCTETGLTEGSHCTRCDGATTAQEVVGALGHAWVDATVDAPKTCSVCGTTEGAALGVVAQIGDVKYETLQNAINAAVNGDTITLVNNVVIGGTTIDLKKSITIDGNGFTITHTDDFAANASNAMFDIMNGATVTFKNLTIDGVKDAAIMRTVNANVVIDNCTIQNCEQTVAQGLLRLACGNATITNSKFLNNTCTMVVSFGFDAANETDVLTIDGCTFEGNTCGETAVVYFADGDYGTVTNTKFIDNTVTATGNAATLYMGWGDGFEVSGCLFDGNSVTTSHATTKRFASAIFADGCAIENNVFLDNSATRNGEAIDTAVAVAAYYGEASVSGNYWNGGKPAYTVEYTRCEVEMLDYYTSYNPETGLPSGETTKLVAKVGKYSYETFAEAFAAAVNGDTIVLLDDIVIDSETYTIAGGVSITLDMNGKKITVTDNKTSNYELFYIYGEMTVTGNGTIELTSTNNRAWNAMSAIFHNRGGILTIENGTFKNLGGTDMAWVVDNSGNWYGDAITNINGGVLESTYTAIRNRMEQNSHGASGTAYLNISGGSITGTTSAIWAQAASTSTTAPATGEINISGGEIGNINTARSAGAECMTTITGGTVNGFKGEVGELTVNGGTLLGTVAIYTADNEAVDYVVDANGLYALAVAKINGNNYATLQDAIDAANGETVVILTDITLTESVVIDGITVTLDLNGHKIDAAFDAEIVEVILARNNAVVTITGNGTMTATGEGEHVEVISAIDGARVTIENGTFVSDGCTTIYATRGAVVTIIGGYYEAKELYNGMRFVLDINEAEEVKGVIVVNGGSFKDFNPANHNNDGENSNKLAAGLHAIADEGIYTVGAHSYSSVVTAPTCTEAGYTTYTCACGDTYIADPVDALGHTAGSAVVENNVAPDCENAGSYDNVVYCTVCGAEISRTRVTVDALGHTEVVDAAVAPNCTATGLTEGKHCSVCNEVLVAQTVVDALGHTAGSAVVENNVAPDCENAGSYDNVVYCTVCGAEISRTRVTVDALGHTEVVDAAVAPNCTATGLTEGKHCSVCNEVLVAQTVVDALGHTAGNTVVENNVAPDCENAGSYDNVVYCTVCNAEISRTRVTVNALGHTEVVDAAVAPNCTATGLTEGKHCSVCNEVLVAQTVVDALGHTAGSAVVENNVAPDCENAGSYDNVVYCTVCDAEISRTTVTVDALGHNYGEWTETTAPTCTTKGEETRACSCGATETKEVAAKGHTSAEAVVENKVEATCTAAGSYESVVYCTVCDAEISRTTVVIPVVSHTPAEAVVENDVPATCTTAGSYDKVTYCSECNAELSREAITVDALGHDIVIDEAKSPTCTETGLTEGSHCSRCDDMTVAQGEIPATGHTYTESKVEPTCTEDGCTRYECACGDYYVRDIIDALGHSYADGVCTTCGEDESSLEDNSFVELWNVIFKIFAWFVEFFKKMFSFA